MKYLILFFLVVGCGKAHNTINDPSPTPSPSPTESVVQSVAASCYSEVSFLDVAAAYYTVTTNADLSRSVTCSVIDSNGNQYSSTANYTELSADRYFATCLIYYKTSYWLRFDSPGYYVTTQPDKNPLTNGWHMSGMPEYPSDGITFPANTCHQ